MRRRLVIVSLAVTSMVTLAFLIPLMLLVAELASDRALTSAERDAQTVAQVLGALGATGDPDDAVQRLGFGETVGGRALSIVIATADGELETVGSPLAPGEDLSRALGGEAFRGPVPGGEVVYVPVVLPGDEIAVVRVLVPAEDLRSGVARSWLILVLLGVTLILGAVAVADRLGRSMVGPVSELSDMAHRLGTGDLRARVEPSGPDEVVEVGRALNRLAGRVESLIEAEREGAADLAHRLRTPLTALRLDVEALAPGARTDRVGEDLDELSRTVDWVIQEARRPMRSDGAVSDFQQIVLGRVAFWTALAEEQGRRGALETDGMRAYVAVSAGDADAAVDALLGNVFAHTNEGVDYAVCLTSEGGSVTLIVEDAGAGFTSADHAERGRSGAGSTGLGLDIARRTAVAAGGSLEIGTSDRLGGGRVAITLPLVTSQR